MEDNNVLLIDFKGCNTLSFRLKSFKKNELKINK